MKRFSTLLFLFLPGLYAQMHPLQELIEAARTHSPRLKDLIAGGLPGLHGRDGAAVWGQEFLFAVESEAPASVSIDRQPAAAMTPIPGAGFSLAINICHSDARSQPIQANAAVFSSKSFSYTQ